MPRQENATDVHAEAIRQRQVDVSFGLATSQGDMLTSADESDTNPDPVNYTEVPGIKQDIKFTFMPHATGSLRLQYATRSKMQQG